ncbi:response regulator transcription factor [Lactobacillus kefiranofaciens]|uniref:DNA-binding response regulator, OmpR family, contains REC and winged-helix (WHTH) domain n=1 Tax=Lactobacillus kefiranofaciens TaxID=267818 RepID=A0AAX3UDA4_9LACO|nr:response regulator transcription factor [Lactobacillus kefiranofaciens]AEG40927.1 Response regulator [Lactobacillus kefiranofaciens subsp. kefiranofaciens]KRM22026.1 response regulator [Lactobacillus kefiranofaciens subsp. kefiranofaciens DSM 5016 = JCM 6985]MCJ2172226.1 response regulator transcription factor [Lactobacillus kefiranofaciens]PAK98540.1 DNA-binding response regulator [Lactobacillus kefiranofaciens]QFQ68591.1 response regulator transcription factor [Lactobacillus kefiranofacie
MDEKDVKILLVEDEEGVASFVKTELELEGYQVIWAQDGKEALELFKNKDPTLILLDWMLPVYDGITVLRRIRKQSDIPIIMLTAKNSASDITSALDQGLDDYITKPFDIEELFARIRVILRRLRRENKHKNTETTSFTCGPLKVDLVKHKFYCNDEKIYLTPKEFALIVELMRDPETVKSRDELLNAVWGYDFVGQTNTVDVYIRNIRNKLGTPYKNIIKTVRGLDYCLRVENES